MMVLIESMEEEEEEEEEEKASLVRRCRNSYGNHVGGNPRPPAVDSETRCSPRAAVVKYIDMQ
jgi:hypothetical protein